MRAWILITLLPAISCIDLPDLSVKASWTERGDAGSASSRRTQDDEESPPTLDPAHDAGSSEPPRLLRTETGKVGPEGGVVELETGARVELPAGAVDSTFSLTLHELDLRYLPPLPQGVSPGVAHGVSPYGALVLLPVSVTLPFETTTLDPVAIYTLHSSYDIRWQKLDAEKTEGLVKAQTPAFGIFVPVRLSKETCDTYKVCGDACVDTKSHPKHCGDCDHACPDHQSCKNGACTEKGASCKDSTCPHDSGSPTRDEDAGVTKPPSNGKDHEDKDAGTRPTVDDAGVQESMGDAATSVSTEELE